MARFNTASREHVTAQRSAERSHLLMVADAAAAPVVEPCPRSNSMATVHQGKLFLYGGMFEVGNRQFTLNDFYCLDLHKMDQWEVLVQMDPSKKKNTNPNKDRVVRLVFVC